MAGNGPLTFPVDVFAHQAFPGRIGELLRDVRFTSMFPPYPWGQWTYARLLAERRSLPGDVLEAGVGWGGMSFFLGLLLKEWGDDRHVFSVDSFEGLPEPDAHKDNPYFTKGQYASMPAGDPLEAMLEGAEFPLLESFRMKSLAFGIADRVTPVRGFFDDVLPSLEPGREFSFVHIDGDIYSSVYSALDAIYDRVVAGGVIAIDDFFHPVQGPIRAAAQFFNARGLSPVYNVVFPYSVFIVKKDWGQPPRGVDGNSYSLQALRGDSVLMDALAASRRRSRKDARDRRNCERLLETLESPPYPGEIYDYWSALERFWSTIDVRPDDRVPIA